MSFCVRNLSVLAYANGFTLWHYRAASDTLPAMQRAGYFEDAREVLSNGDMLLVNALDGAQMLCVAVDQGQVSVAGMGSPGQV